MSDLNKVILIGLDGVGQEEVSKILRSGSLENLNSLDEMCGLLSTQPPWTPCAWPSLLSGRNPGKHGVFDFFTRDGYNKRLIERSDVDSPYLFEAADAHGLTSLAVNYPVTHPVSELEHGAVVPGYLAQEDTEFHPKGLREEYEAEYGDYVIYPEYGTDDDAVREYVDVARCRRDMAEFLDSKYDWDLMAVQFQVTDSIFHDLDDRDEIRQVLEKVDEFVGDIIDLGGEDSTVIIASDHGMGDYDWTFYINSWLAKHGYCEVTEGESQYFRQQKDELKGKSDEKDEASPLATTVKTMASSLSKVGLSPQRIHSGLSTIGAAGYVERLLPTEALVAAQNQVVDHENSQAFQLYFNSLGVHLNVQGRDPSGVIPEQEYDAVRSELIAELKEVRDPDGELVFDDVEPREEVYEGQHLDDAPDIVLTPRDYRYDVSGSILDTFRRYPHKNHKPEGILLSNRSLNTDDGAKIYDIAPTVAAALGIPIDSQTDGRNLLETDDELEREDWDILADGYVGTGADTDTQSVEDRLADLGYME
ncbi:alkaline phosphatase family protein [Haloferax marisrubri]|uniref:Nucleotide pyrophosphatase n=1 Tax=Haloferax marisrubri TaxID=1544719 RepID=A0A2P4NQV7_9EURY|nr:alkaline phosphatase family protein [Haloferax marisrubri]POG55527.1 nucleotide pyrophosphatase [Haloferax marisrubri]